ncbi:hypothetical protein PQE20_17595 [Vibrio harveyi]|uniref:hypothetical protein n=1 Tax=Vibrio harveyi TaxID=669 RepID=UPI00234D57FF|nr:hypothetical protein [Vibrio harveyi]WCP83232.1 hypothetical protein PQE20_17595 [Vibrio harveyi]
MRIDNSGLEKIECPKCKEKHLILTNELSFDDIQLNVDVKCGCCKREYWRVYEALYVGFNNCEDFSHLPQEEFNVNEDETGEKFEVGGCYNCRSLNLSASEDPYFGENYLSETFTCDDCGLETYVEFYDCDGFSQE